MKIHIDYGTKHGTDEVEVEDYELTDGFLMLKKNSKKEYKSLSDISRFKVHGTDTGNSDED